VAKKWRAGSSSSMVIWFYWGDADMRDWTKGRMAKCRNCGEEFFYIYNRTRACPNCGSTDFVLEERKWRRRWVG